MRFFPKGAFTAAPDAPVVQVQIQQQLQQNQIVLQEVQQIEQLQQQQQQQQQQRLWREISMPGFALCPSQLVANPGWYQAGMGGFGRPLF